MALFFFPELVEQGHESGPWHDLHDGLVSNHDLLKDLVQDPLLFDQRGLLPDETQILQQVGRLFDADRVGRHQAGQFPPDGISLCLVFGLVHIANDVEFLESAESGLEQLALALDLFQVGAAVEVAVDLAAPIVGQLDLPDHVFDLGFEESCSGAFELRASAGFLEGAIAAIVAMLLRAGAVELAAALTAAQQTGEEIDSGRTAVTGGFAAVALGAADGLAGVEEGLADQGWVFAR
jgi:hypothetical protein